MPATLPLRYNGHGRPADGEANEPSGVGAGDGAGAGAPGWGLLTYGHQTGDFVLKEAAAFLKANIGPTDFIARYGGEEFVILLASLNLRQAAEKIAEAISRLGQLNLEYQGKQLRFTFSCGIAECRPSENVESLIDRADKNTYEAKRRGKNQVFSGVSVPEGSRSATFG